MAVGKESGQLIKNRYRHIGTSRKIKIPTWEMQLKKTEAWKKEFLPEYLELIKYIIIFQ